MGAASGEVEGCRRKGRLADPPTDWIEGRVPSALRLSCAGRAMPTAARMDFAVPVPFVACWGFGHASDADARAVKLKRWAADYCHIKRL